MDILGVCSIALDTFCSVDHLPIIDSFCTVLSTEKHQGGSGTNVLVQTQKIGAQSGIITKIAMDKDSDVILENLSNSHIDSRGVYRQPGNNKAPHCLIYVDPKGEKTLVLDKPSEMSALSEDEADLSLIDEANIIYIDLSPAILGLLVLRIAHGKGKKVVLNIQDDMDTVRSRGVTDEMLYKNLKYLDIFAPSQEGIKGLTGESTVDGQIKEIRKHYSGKVILTLGAKGLVAFDESNSRFDLPTYKVDAIDTTGAGDSFIGTFMTAFYVNKLDFESALKYSTAAAALTCTKMGAQSSPNAKEVALFIKDHKF